MHLATATALIASLMVRNKQKKRKWVFRFKDNHLVKRCPFCNHYEEVYHRGYIERPILKCKNCKKRMKRSDVFKEGEVYELWFYGDRQLIEAIHKL